MMRNKALFCVKAVMYVFTNNYEDTNTRLLYQPQWISNFTLVESTIPLLFRNVHGGEK